ncbi:MAG TPA: nuclear transport factor 2 family protein [Candidatus Binatia bacterium]|nr:nuclear transport factor 2 family protein [Candidatus Binatia bacterium]
MRLDVIRRYYDACNRGDAEGVARECTPDVVHYFLVPGTAPVAGAEHLGRYWRKVRSLLDCRWDVDHALEQGDEAVIEWTMAWRVPETGDRRLVHGAEWYVFEGDRIAEIRAYYDQRADADTGLVGFPYRERGYTEERVPDPRQTAG